MNDSLLFSDFTKDINNINIEKKVFYDKINSLRS